MNLYERLADDIENLIRKGVYRPGDRVPSVRQASQQHRISITTVIRAYLLLESRGMLESRPQSGYFVSLRAQEGDRSAHGLCPTRPIAVSASVDVSRLVLSTLRSISVDRAVPLGSPYPDPELFPFEKLNRYAWAVGRNKALWGVTNGLPPGSPDLLRQIARRYLENGMTVDPNEIIVTVGATEAINLCLQAVAKAGDVIAVESPTFYAMLHAIERSGMKAIEVATHPEYGIDIDELARIIDSQPIAACMVMPNFQNPLGFQMPDERKRALVELLAGADVPIIENGVCNELYFGKSHPSTLKSFDKKGTVLHCASFSKSLTAAYRIGWALPGRYRDQVEKLKFLNTLTTPVIPQLAIAEYLERDGYEHHLRRVRRNYAQQASLMRAMVTRFFPAGTRISSPAGGYVLWVELPSKVDSMMLYKLLLEKRITIGPGYMFSVSDSYRNFIRLNYSSPWSTEIEQAVITVGKLATACAR
ncbi:GntR family transcriptional regulator [Paraburkholderia sp. BL6669N2]|uniref:aminotransferase-like domain-containing protein n=1 Tax=unclassified Paraburkholderia TaxID=2615204 RepID=UPI000E2537AA|nr:MULTISPECIES: PLP-dependent aminotransferase family protein [unclassified Paraburkholderia]REG48779.1 GntR family transcriptional regulator [Paraburkholderia sp. BL6669N2]TDY23460.1 GntR family transcriptional regulator [Paraburkholderia sp. BL6665CI2N2]